MNRLRRINVPSPDALSTHLVSLGRSGRSALLTARWPVGAEIAVSHGRVLHAHSLIAPSPEAMLRARGRQDEPPTNDDPPPRRPSAREAGVTLAHALRVRNEAVVDTLRELIVGGAEHPWRRRRLPHPPAPDETVDLTIDSVLAEAQRRQRVLQALAPLVGPDVPVARKAQIAPGRVRVAPQQWALLATTSIATTPRSLANTLGDSVFRMTCRVAELLRAGLLQVADSTAVDIRADTAFHTVSGMWFLEATTGAESR